eukprot:6180297-Pleurochrysis_carterae.AAC.1
MLQTSFTRGGIGTRYVWVCINGEELAAGGSVLVAQLVKLVTDHYDQLAAAAARDLAAAAARRPNSNAPAATAAAERPSKRKKG